MSLILLLIGFASLIGSGFVFARWLDNQKDTPRMISTIGLGLIGSYMVISAIGNLIRHCS